MGTGAPEPPWGMSCPNPKAMLPRAWWPPVAQEMSQGPQGEKCTRRDHHPYTMCQRCHPCTWHRWVTHTLMSSPHLTLLRIRGINQCSKSKEEGSQEGAR